MKTLPQRMCVCCRGRFNQDDLFRVTRYQGNYTVLRGSISNGRSAYFCGSGECVKKLLKSKALDRAFKENVPNTVYEDLIALSSLKNED